MFWFYLRAADLIFSLSLSNVKAFAILFSFGKGWLLFVSVVLFCSIRKRIAAAQVMFVK